MGMNDNDNEKADNRDDFGPRISKVIPLQELRQEEAKRHQHQQQQQGEQDEMGPIRIRNLEDLIRQLEHSSNRHMSPAGSEDVRMSSETEADRHFRSPVGVGHCSSADRYFQLSY